MPHSSSSRGLWAWLVRPLYNHFCAKAPMGYLELGAQWAQSCIGYSWPSQPNPDGLAREAWDTVRHGVQQLAWFAPFCDETPPRGRFSYLAGNCTLNGKGKAIAQINRQLLAGPGDVAVNTTPVADGVFLSHTVCLGTRELELLRDFAEAGGCVVAEGGTARRDGNGRLYEEAPESFRELFGVERPAPSPSPMAGRDGVVACGAQRIESISPQLGVAYRKGRAFFLDFVVTAGGACLGGLSRSSVRCSSRSKENTAHASSSREPHGPEAG